MREAQKKELNPAIDSFDWSDPLAIDDELDNEEHMIRESVARYCQEQLQPRILDANRHETVDRGVFKEMGEMGMLGSTIKDHGCPGLSYVCYGLIAREVERVDSAYRYMLSVQSSLFM